jgi:hypothetical protein
MSAITIELPSELLEALQHLAKQRGKSEQELIQEALAQYAGLGPRPMPPGVGQYRSGRSDVSARARQILRQAVKEGRWP